MPLYSYQCKQCGEKSTKVNSIDNHKEGPGCCGEMMSQVIEATMVNAMILGGGSYPGYKCSVTGEYVTSRKRRTDIMKEHNLVECGGSDLKRHVKE